MTACDLLFGLNVLEAERLGKLVKKISPNCSLSAASSPATRFSMDRVGDGVKKHPLLPPPLDPLCHPKMPVAGGLLKQEPVPTGCRYFKQDRRSPPFRRISSHLPYLDVDDRAASSRARRTEEATGRIVSFVAAVSNLFSVAV